MPKTVKKYLFFSCIILFLILLTTVTIMRNSACKKLEESKIESLQIAFELENLYKEGFVIDGKTQRHARALNRQFAYDCMMYLAENNVRDHNAIAVTSNFVKLDKSYDQIPKNIKDAIESYLSADGMHVGNSESATATQ